MSVQMRKQTKIWKCKDGTKVRICDMTDSHLINCIKLLKRTSQVQLQNFGAFGSMLQGEMAQDCFDRDYDRLLEFSDDELAGEMFRPIYDSLISEAQRRDLNLEN